MPEQFASAIVLPSGVSPADAENVRAEALRTLEFGRSDPSAVSLDIDGPSPTPGAVQLLISTIRTAELMNVNLTILDRCEGVLKELQIE